MGSAHADASLVKTGFYQGYTVSTAITEPTEAQRPPALTRRVGRPKAAALLRKALLVYVCVCVQEIHKLLTAGHTCHQIYCLSPAAFKHDDAHNDMHARSAHPPQADVSVTVLDNSDMR